MIAPRGYSRWSDRDAVSLVRDALIFITAFSAVWTLVHVRWPGVPIWPFVLMGAVIATLGPTPGSVWSSATKWILRPAGCVVAWVWGAIPLVLLFLAFLLVIAFATLHLLPIRILRQASDRVVFVFFWTSVSLGAWAVARTMWSEVPWWPFILTGALIGPVLIAVIRAFLLISALVVPNGIRDQVRRLYSDFSVAIGPAIRRAPRRR